MIHTAHENLQLNCDRLLIVFLPSSSSSFPSTTTTTSVGITKQWMVDDRLPATTLRQALTYFLDISTPPSQMFLQLLATLATDPEDKHKLEEYASVSTVCMSLCFSSYVSVCPSICRRCSFNCFLHDPEEYSRVGTVALSFCLSTSLSRMFLQPRALLTSDPEDRHKMEGYTNVSISVFLSFCVSVRSFVLLSQMFLQLTELLICC